MGKITKHIPTDLEVKGIFADTYRLFLQYKDIDLFEYENEINLACEAIEGNYEGCKLSATFNEAILRLFLDRSRANETISSSDSR